MKIAELVVKAQLAVDVAFGFELAQDLLILRDRGVPLALALELAGLFLRFLDVQDDLDRRRGETETLMEVSKLFKL